MPDADPAPAQKSPAVLVFGAFGLFLAIIGSCGVYFLWPRGERLGAIDLRADPATLSVDLGAGDKLNFRIDTVTVGTTTGYSNSSRSRTNKVQEELKASVITITSVGNDGAAKASTECGASAHDAELQDARRSQGASGHQRGAAPSG